jgi:NADPH:quinone reductase-like Zn-dependent oxidoreductase
VIAATGKKASRFREGDEVIPLVIQGYSSGMLIVSMAMFSLGGPINGTLGEYGVSTKSR